MAEDEDLLDAIEEWEDRCKEAERQSAALVKAVDWMSHKVKVLESERDGANLQMDALTKAIQIAIPILGKGCKCDGCNCEMEMATDILRDALKPKVVKPTRCSTCGHNNGRADCVHDWAWSGEIRTTSPAFRRRSCSKCPATECIMVCGPDDDRVYPCQMDDCHYCRKPHVSDER